MFYDSSELSKLGLKSVGKNVLISDKCSIYNPSNISIGDNVRIDDFLEYHQEYQYTVQLMILAVNL